MTRERTRARYSLLWARLILIYPSSHLERAQPNCSVSFVLLVELDCCPNICFNSRRWPTVHYFSNETTEKYTSLILGYLLHISYSTIEWQTHKLCIDEKHIHKINIKLTQRVKYLCILWKTAMTSHVVWPSEAHKASRLVTSVAGFYAPPYISNKLHASTPETPNSKCTLHGTVWVFRLVAGVIKKYFVVILSGLILVISIFLCSLN